MTIRKLIFIFLFLFAGNLTNAQTTQAVDSLKEQLANAKDDTSRINGANIRARNPQPQLSLFRRIPLANEHSGQRWWFGVGAVTASVVWFVSLGLGARRLSRLFATPLTWRILDGIIAVTMIGLGVSLAVS